MSQRLNLKDIARLAGVSRSTVSRVINNHPYVSPDKRERVLQVIQANEFEPNPAARMLRDQRSRVIGIVIPNSLNIISDTYYFPTVLQGIAGVTDERDYGTLLWLGRLGGEENERFRKRIVNNRLMDGLLLASFNIGDPLVDCLVEAEIPFVMIERPTQHEHYVNYVTVDNVRAAESAVKHLLMLGRRRIGTLTGTSDNIDARDRLLGYQNALQIANIPFNPELVAGGDFQRRAGYRGMKQLLHRQVDAVFAASDHIAAGALDALHEAGVRVPDDVAIVGFDDLPIAQETRPKLTTIRQPIQQKSAQATTLLIDLIEGIVEGPQQILLPTELVLRDSCGAVQ